MSRTVPSSSIINSSKKLASHGGWQEGIIVFAMILAPIVFAAIIMLTGLAAIAGWQMVHGMAAKLPTAESTLYGMLAYAVACWIAVAAVWLWSSRQGLRSEVFVFQRISWSGLIASFAAFIVVMYAIPAVTHWLTYLTGGKSQGVRIDFHDAQSVLTYIFLFVVTAPICEEILYRGLLVAWLRRAGWRASTILLVGSFLFGANHYLPLGSFVWSAAMVGLGAILYALRLRYHSLSPGWLAHVLFNAQPFLVYPLIWWLPSGLHPGHL